VAGTFARLPQIRLRHTRPYGPEGNPLPNHPIADNESTGTPELLLSFVAVVVAGCPPAQVR